MITTTTRTTLVAIVDPFPGPTSKRRKSVTRSLTESFVQRSVPFSPRCTGSTHRLYPSV